MLLEATKHEATKQVVVERAVEIVIRELEYQDAHVAEAQQLHQVAMVDTYIIEVLFELMLDLRGEQGGAISGTIPR